MFCASTKSALDWHCCRLVVLAVAVALLGAQASQCAVHADEQPAIPMSYERGVLIRFTGPITGRLEKFLYRELDDARRQQADLIVLEIDSPGGYLEESWRIATRLRDTKWAHTVAFVPRGCEALSGAAIVSLGCDEIIIDRDAHFGDAGVIAQDAEYFFQYADEKLRTDLALKLRTLAEAKGRPPALAEAMIDKDLIVYRVKNNASGRETYMSDAEIKSSANPDDWTQLHPVLETREKRFLEVNGARAVELQLAEGNAGNRDELKQRYGLEQDFVVLQQTWVDTAAYILNLPLVTGLLFVIGLVALYVEFSAPGISIGGLTAGLCFALFFWSRFLGGTAGWLEVVLFAAGIVFLAVEIFVLPGFGWSGITGILLLLASVIMASQDFSIANPGRQLVSLAHTLLILLGSGVVFVVIAAVLSRYYGSLPVLNRLVLQPPTGRETAASATKDQAGKPLANAPGNRFSVSVGDWGVAASPLRPAGKMRIGIEYLDVVTDGSFVDKGTQVKVIEVSGNRVVVREVDT